MASQRWVDARRPARGRDRVRRPRRWRLRSRSGQVSAIATILALLLVVTFIANYLTTTLPNQMSINDLQRDLIVVNQIGRLDSLLQAVSSPSSIGAQVSQPIQLGSQGDPPFAGSDGAQVTSLANGSALSLSYTLVGPADIVTPTVQAGGTSRPAGACTITTTTVTCVSGGARVWGNFTGSSAAYTATLTSGETFAALNYSVNGATITVTVGSTTATDVDVFGSSDTIVLSNTGATALNVTVVGTKDTIAIANGGGGGHEHLLAVGTGISATVTTGGSSLFSVALFGTNDTFTPQAAATSGSNVYAVYLNGLTTTAPSLSCPQGNVPTTDKVLSNPSAWGNGNTMKIFFNDTTGTPGSTTPATGWTNTTQNPTAFACPFVAQVTIPVATSITPGAGVDVHLANIYAPVADAALDEGAVVFAQPGGTPVMDDGPSIATTVSGTTVTSLTVWLPQFVGAFPSQSGYGTADFTARLLAVTTISIATGGPFSLSTISNVVLSIATPFAPAWMTWIEAQGWPITPTCVPATGPACVGPYASNGAIGTVSLTIPAAGLAAFTVTTATFAVGLD